MNHPSVCPTCSKIARDMITNDQGVFRWCPNCGTLVTFSGSILQPTISRVYSVREPHGLLVVAAEAVQNANKEIGLIEQKTGSPQTILWSITEALAAIIHELDARELDRRDTDNPIARGLTAAMRAEEHGEIAKVIAAGMNAVLLERERCAKLAEDFGHVVFAKQVRKVPT